MRGRRRWGASGLSWSGEELRTRTDNVRCDLGCQLGSWHTPPIPTALLRAGDASPLPRLSRLTCRPPRHLRRLPRWLLCPTSPFPSPASPGAPAAPSARAKGCPVTRGMRMVPLECHLPLEHDFDI